MAKYLITLVRGGRTAPLDFFLFSRLLIAALLSAICLPLSAQLNISGRVTDATGETLIGVSVLEKDSGRGTVTDVEGRFNLRIAGPKSVLLVSYVGMETRVVTVGNRTELTIELQELAALLNQVVVTAAYRGAQDVKDLVGSYAAIDQTELLTDRPVESVDKLLEGRIAGVQVQITTGEPGLPVKVQVRGQGSLPSTGNQITASTQPLFVLDGVPLYDITETNNTASVFTDNLSQRLNPLAFLNPDDIESITVLKDASATALYGADAANGVVLITTKKGSAASERISVSLNQGFAQTINEIKFLNTAQYVELARETLFNSGRNPAEAGRSDIETDWRDLVQRTARNTDLDISMAGGTRAGLGYRISGSYNENQSIHVGNGIRQGNFGINLTVPLIDRMTLDTRISLAYQRREGLGTFDAFTFPPNLPVYREDGTFNNDGFFAMRGNPAAVLEQNENFHTSYSINSKLALTYQALPTLRLRVLGGADRLDAEQFQYLSALNGTGASAGGRLRNSSRDNLQWVANAQAIWNPKLGETDHHPSLLAGGELNGQTTRQISARGSNFPYDDLRRLAFLGSAETDVGESIFERNKASLYGEIAYDYDYRYYLKFNARRDASSIFGGDRQANLFYALGASWNLSQEKFWQDATPLGISFVKLRFSYGVTGNSRLGVYSAAGLYRFNTSGNYGGQLPLITSSPVNQSLSWEIQQQTNVGLDLGFSPGSPFTITLEYYYNLTTDALRSVDIPYENGFNTLLTNAANLYNRGYEATIRYDRPDAGRFDWSTSFNFAINKNRLTRIALQDLPTANGSNLRALIIGQDVNTLYGIPAAGVDPENGQQLYRLIDGTITSDANLARGIENFVPLGASNPDFFGGWHNRFSYGNLSLTAQINYSYGSTEVIDPLTFRDGNQILFNNQSINQLDRWQQPGDLTDTPRPSIDNPFVSRSSRYFFDVNYLQLSNVTLSYKFDPAGRMPLGTRSLSFFTLVNNVGYLYDEKRRKDRNGVAEYRFRFPEQRAFVFGCKLGW